MNKYFPVTHSTISVKALTTDILPKYNLGTVIDCRLLCLGLNDTYAVKTENGEQYIFRVYRAGWRSLSDIAYELDALSHLNCKSVPVAKPLPQQDRQLTQTLLAPEGTRYAVLFTYAPGKDLSYEAEAEMEVFNYGKTAARIHNATQDFTSLNPRCSIDLDYLLNTPLKSIAPLLSHRPEDWEYLQYLADKIRGQLVELPIDELEQGFCHGDFHGGNAHISNDGVITFFDFDCCGWGWRAYDIAVFKWGARLRGKEKEYWEPFLKGYQAERTLKDIDLRAVHLFIGIRNFCLVGLHAANGHDWGFGWINDRYFDKSIKFFRDWDSLPGD
jgi:Ser/Thr protein kinase RdoA (MazF antagonist)